MERYYRLHPGDEDPERLLDPDEQQSEPWEGTVFGRCDKCGGSGRTEHRCESCEDSPSEDCPACHGRGTYEAECPACQGTGEIDDSARDGVSVFPDEDGLYRYMLGRDADIGGSQLVVLEGRASEDEDFDADEGALLILPERIVEVREPDLERVEALRASG